MISRLFSRYTWKLPNWHKWVKSTYIWKKRYFLIFPTSNQVMLFSSRLFYILPQTGPSFQSIASLMKFKAHQSNAVIGYAVKIWVDFCWKMWRSFYNNNFSWKNMRRLCTCKSTSICHCSSKSLLHFFPKIYLCLAKAAKTVQHITIPAKADKICSAKFFDFLQTIFFFFQETANYLLQQIYHCISQLYTTPTNFSTKYLVMCKVYSDVGGIK